MSSQWATQKDQSAEQHNLAQIPHQWGSHLTELTFSSPSLSLNQLAQQHRKRDICRVRPSMTEIPILGRHSPCCVPVPFSAVPLILTSTITSGSWVMWWLQSYTCILHNLLMSSKKPGLASGMNCWKEGFLPKHYGTFCFIAFKCASGFNSKLPRICVKRAW